MKKVSWLHSSGFARGKGLLPSKMKKLHFPWIAVESEAHSSPSVDGMPRPRHFQSSKMIGSRSSTALVASVVELDSEVHCCCSTTAAASMLVVDLKIAVPLLAVGSPQLSCKCPVPASVQVLSNFRLHPRRCSM